MVAAFLEDHDVRIKEVGWSPPDPITFSYFSHSTPQLPFVNWQAQELGTPLRPASHLQKLWPAGTFGSGPYDFSLIPDCRDLPYRGTNIPTNAGASKLQHGPWFKVDGGLVLNSDRPCQALQLFGFESGGDATYFACSTVAPTLDFYHREFRSLSSACGIDLIGEDGSTRSYDAFDFDPEPRLDKLAALINPDFTLLTASVVFDESQSLWLLRLTPAGGYGVFVADTRSMSETNLINPADYGGLVLDFSGNTSEKIFVIE